MNTITPIPIMIPYGGGNFNGTILDMVWVFLIIIQIICWLITTANFMCFNEHSSKEFLLRIIPLSWLVFSYLALRKKLKQRW